MRKNVFFQVFLLLMLGCLFFSCSKTSDNEVEYFAFQETKGGDWGLISPDGEVLFSGEFDKAPTVVRDGRFFVRNINGYWELFEADKKPKKIGSEYLSASAFRDGYAFVVEKDKPVSIINTKGETVKELHKIEGKTVLGVYAPNMKGNAIFQTTDTLYGVIDVSGDCVIKPEYIELNSFGMDRYIAVSKKYKDTDGKKYSILNKNGEVLFDVSADRYKEIGTPSLDGKLVPVAVEKNDEIAWGLLNDKGEEVLKPTTRIEKISAVFGDKFIFLKDGKWGLMNLEGEKLIYAKYDELMFDETKNVLIAGKEDNGMSWKYINEEDEQLSPETYTRAKDFSILDGKHTIVKPDDHIYALINSEYEMLKDQPDMVDVSLSEGNGWIESDYIDLNAFIAQLQLKPNSIIGISLQSKPADVAKQYFSWHGNFEDDPRLYDGNQLTMEKSLYFTDLAFKVVFDAGVSEDTRYEEFDPNVSEMPDESGIEWTNIAKAQTIMLGIASSSKLQSKMKTLFGMIAEIYKKGATIVKQNKNALLLKYKDGSMCVVTRDYRGITVCIMSEIVATELLERLSAEIDNNQKEINEDDANPRY